jgi:DUF1009 family protein
MEAKRTFFIERKQALEYANKHKLLVVAKWLVVICKLL